MQRIGGRGRAKSEEPVVKETRLTSDGPPQLLSNIQKTSVGRGRSMSAQPAVEETQLLLDVPTKLEPHTLKKPVGRGRSVQSVVETQLPPDDPSKLQPHSLMKPLGRGRSTSVQLVVEDANLSSDDPSKLQPQTLRKPVGRGRSISVQSVVEETQLPPDDPPKLHPHTLMKPVGHAVSKLLVVPSPDGPPQVQPNNLYRPAETREVGRPPQRHHFSIPLRKKTGKLGRYFTVETNHLALDIVPTNRTVYHYDVVIDPEKPYYLYRKVVEKLQQKRYPNIYPAFDGRKNLYTALKLEIKGEELRDAVTVWDEEKSKEKVFKIKIKLVNGVRLNTMWDYLESGTSTEAPQEAIHALDIVLRNSAAHNFVQVGKSYFTAPPGPCITLGNNLDLWYGFFQSAILGWRPFLNIDVAHKLFPSPVNVIEVIRNILLEKEERERRRTGGGLGGGGGDCGGRRRAERVEDSLHRELDFQIRKPLGGFLRGLKIIYAIPNQASARRTYSVNDVVDSAMMTKFCLENGKELTVAHFFKMNKHYELKYPMIPCLHVGPIKKNISLPAELCTIVTGQTMKSKLNESQEKEMNSQATRPPDERKRKILASMRKVSFNKDRCISQFGIKVNTDFEKVNARILEPPLLQYTLPVMPKDGTWQPEKLYETIMLTNWTVINIDYNISQEHLCSLAAEMRDMGNMLGMNISEPRVLTNLVRRNEGLQIKVLLEELFIQQKKINVQLVLVVMPSSSEHYAKIKQVAELHTGILTQCVKTRTIMQCSRATVTNILLKVNAKLNGVNHKIQPTAWPKSFNKVIMVIGADVTHPSIQRPEIPSFAAVVASHDTKAFRYNMIWRLQPPRVEIIEDLEHIVREQLVIFKERTHLKPEGILVYRDGVSEGQFRQVLDTEIQAIRRACSSLGSSYSPSITFLVVQKRHHTRFFPADGRNNNVPTGTIVDTHITHPTELDFYLVSHASLQGTSRPTKYHLLWDDAGMSEDDLEQITYYLCHMSTRCTRSVAYPAPTYYAHLAAFRIRAYFEKNLVIHEKITTTQARMKINEMLLKKNPMFFI